ncbi:hypothetical protein KHP60_09905 [Microvirga sp. 3-52]|uniref:hypothetical protein n=1 Tax=Microvirga sp. 3-52 TaxID=2792425 RepID=UPI001AC21486|nr:hypothetical protein [Microvirga sp. 3-52]MBO1905626.1 hypothetical protein [Microvirga sp. 3-52]MBS7452648.1 hypothetical protein [Microvirga sp. 3-52]
MSVAPGYRLRLFLSVDLVGSTAYKSGPGKEPDSNPESEYPNRPTWVGNIQKFFTDFPEIFRAQVSKVWEGADASAPSPQVWKTIGDEIVFCLRLRTSNDLVKTIAAFVHALQDYGLILERDGGYLDVKGAGWVAAFPVPNITIRRSGSSVDEASDLRDESFEEEADSAPAQFEFLGTEIDAGFRVARHAAPDRFVLSAQLALLLVSACGESQSPFHFHYHGRETMKGVLNGREYVSGA